MGNKVKVIFTDLDATLVHNKEQYELHEQKDELIQFDYYTGQEFPKVPTSYIHKDTLDFLLNPGENVVIIPVTARTNIEQVPIIDKFHVVIYANGDKILTKNYKYIQDEWTRRMESLSSAFKTENSSRIEELEHILSNNSGRIVDAHNKYHVLKGGVKEVIRFKHKIEKFKDIFTVSTWGREVFLAPKYVNKTSAVNFILNRLPEIIDIPAEDTILIGAGDSPKDDAGFLMMMSIAFAEESLYHELDSILSFSFPGNKPQFIEFESSFYGTNEMINRMREICQQV